MSDLNDLYVSDVDFKNGLLQRGDTPSVDQLKSESMSALNDTEDYVSDGDSIRLRKDGQTEADPYERGRLGTNAKGSAFDAFETSGKSEEWLADPDNIKRMTKQAQALDDLRGVERGTHTYSDVFAQGDKAKKEMSEYISKNREDLVTVQVGFDSKYNRPIYDIQHKDGRSVVEMHNKEGFNADYGSQYNVEFRKRQQRAKRNKQIKEKAETANRWFGSKATDQDLENSVWANAKSLIQTTADSTQSLAGRALNTAVEVPKVLETIGLTKESATEWERLKKKSTEGTLTPYEQQLFDGALDPEDPNYEDNKWKVGMGELPDPADIAKAKAIDEYSDVQAAINSTVEEVAESTNKMRSKNAESRAKKLLATKKKDIDSIQASWESGNYGDALVDSIFLTPEIGSIAVETLIDNPGGAVQHIAQSSADIAMIAGSLGASTIVYAGSNAQENFEGFRKVHGRMPVGNEQVHILANSVLGAVLETAALNFVAGAPVKKLFKGNVPTSTVTSEATQKLADNFEKTFASKAFDKLPGSIQTLATVGARATNSTPGKFLSEFLVRGMVAGGSTEFIEEFGADLFKQDAQKQGKERIDLNQAVEAGTIGAISGIGMGAIFSGATATAAVPGNLAGTPEQQEERRQRKEAAKVKAAKDKEAKRAKEEAKVQAAAAKEQAAKDYKVSPSEVVETVKDPEFSKSVAEADKPAVVENLQEAQQELVESLSDVSTDESGESNAVTEEQEDNILAIHKHLAELDESGYDEKKQQVGFSDDDNANTALVGEGTYLDNVNPGNASVAIAELDRLYLQSIPYLEAAVNSGNNEQAEMINTFVNSFKSHRDHLIDMHGVQAIALAKATTRELEGLDEGSVASEEQNAIIADSAVDTAFGKVDQSITDRILALAEKNVIGESEKHLVNASNSLNQSLKEFNDDHDNKDKVSKTAEEVHSDVNRDGLSSNGKPGLRMHVGLINSALKSGNEEAIKSAVSGFKIFESIILGKRETLKAAIEEFAETGEKVTVALGTLGDGVTEGAPGNYTVKNEYTANKFLDGELQKSVAVVESASEFVSALAKQHGVKIDSNGNVKVPKSTKTKKPPAKEVVEQTTTETPEKVDTPQVTETKAEARPPLEEAEDSKEETPSSNLSPLSTEPTSAVEVNKAVQKYAGADTNATAYEKSLALLFKGMVKAMPKTKFKNVSNPNKSLGQFNYAEDLVTLNTVQNSNYISAQKGWLPVLTHEAIHAVTVEQMYNFSVDPKSVTPAVARSIKILNKEHEAFLNSDVSHDKKLQLVQDSLKNHLSTEGGLLRSQQEFPATVIGSPTLLAHLRGQKEQTPTGLKWKYFTGAIAKVLGLTSNSALAGVIDAIVTISDSTAARKRTGKDLAKPKGKVVPSILKTDQIAVDTKKREVTRLLNERKVSSGLKKNAQKALARPVDSAGLEKVLDRILSGLRTEPEAPKKRNVNKQESVQEVDNRDDTPPWDIEPETKAEARPPLEEADNNAEAEYYSDSSEVPPWLSEVDANLDDASAAEYEAMMEQYEENTEGESEAESIKTITELTKEQMAIAEEVSSAHKILKEVENKATSAGIFEWAIKNVQLAKKTPKQAKEVIDSKLKKLTDYVKTREDGRAVSVLAKYPRFFNTLGKREEPLEPKLTETMTDGDKQVFRDLRDWVSGFNKTFQESYGDVVNIKSIYGADLVKEPTILFQQSITKASKAVDGNQDVTPENYVSALAVSARNLIQGTLADTVSENSLSDIKALIGLDRKVPYVSDGTVETLVDAGSSMKSILPQVGREVRDMLGITEQRHELEDGTKVVTEPQMVDRLDTAIGLQVVTVLAKMNMVDITQVEGTRISEGRQGYGEERYSFIRLASKKGKGLNPIKPRRSVRDRKLVTSAGVQKLLSQNSEQHEITLKKYFGIAPKKRGMPLSSPNKSLATRLGTTLAKPSKLHLEAQKKAQETAWFINKESWEKFDSLGEKAQLTLMGYDFSVEDGSNVKLKSRVANIKSKNSGIRRELNAFKEFVATRTNDNNEVDYDSPFYFKYKFQTQGRLMITGSSVNIQESKLARFMTGTSANKEAIELTKENIDLHTFAAMEALGEKAYEDGKYDEAIDALTEDTLTPEGARAVYNAVNRAGEGIHGYNSLLGLAAIKRAENNGDSSFVSPMHMEIDGTTNGVASLYLQLSGSTDEDGNLVNFEDQKRFLRRTGMIFKGDSYTSFYDYQNRSGEMDNYKTLAEYSNQEIMSNVVENTDLRNFYEKLQYFTGDLVVYGEDGKPDVSSMSRKLHKDGLLTTAYNKSVQSVVSDFSESMIELIHDTVERNAYNPEVLREVAGVLKSMGIGYKNTLSRNPDSALNFDIRSDKKMYDNIKELVKETHGVGITEGLKRLLPTVSDHANLMVSASAFVNSVSHRYYVNRIKEAEKSGRALGTSELELIEKEMVKAGEIQLYKNYSANKNDKFSGIQLVNKESVMVDKAKGGVAVVKVRGGKGVPVITKLAGESDSYSPNNSMSASLYRKEFSQDIGVKAVAVTNISYDADTNARVMKMGSVGNNYDAITGAPNETLRLNQEQNAGYNSIHTNHSMGLEIERMVLSSLTLFNKLSKQDQQRVSASFVKQVSTAYGTMNVSTLKSVTGGIGEDGKNTLKRIDHLVEQVRKMSLDTDKAKSQLITDMDIQAQFPVPFNTTKITHVSTEPTSREEFDKAFEELLEENRETTGVLKTPVVKSFLQVGRSSDPFKHEAKARSGTKERLSSTAASVALDTYLRNDVHNRDTKEHKEYLSDLMESVIAPMLDKMDNYVLNRKSAVQAGSRGSIKEKRGKNIVTVVEGSPRRRRKHSTDQTAATVMVHELLHGVFEHGAEIAPKIMREMADVQQDFNQWASDNNWDYTILLPKDPITGEPSAGVGTVEANRARALFDYITRTDSRGVHEFAAYAMSNEMVMDLVKEIPKGYSNRAYKPPGVSEYANLYQKLFSLVRSLLYKLERAYDKRRNPKDLHTTLLKLAGKARNEITGNVGTAGRLQRSIKEALSGTRGKMEDKVMAPYRDWLESTIMEQNAYHESGVKSVKNSAIRVAIALPTVIHMSKNPQFRKGITYARNTSNLNQRGMVLSLINEIRGTTKFNLPMRKLLRNMKQQVEQSSESAGASIRDQLRTSFVKPLDKVQSAAMHRSVMKTGMYRLTDRFTPEQLVKLLESKTTVAYQISRLEREINSSGFPQANANFYRIQAEGLGVSMATGRHTLNHQLLNGDNIANLHGVSKELGYTPKGDLKKAAKLIEQLASLHAIYNTDANVNESAAAVIEREIDNNPERNGFSTMISLHTAFVDQSRDELFQGNEFNMGFGYTKDDLPRDVEFTVGTNEQAVRLRNEGYIRQDRIKGDPLDPLNGKTRYLWIKQVASSGERQNGLMSNKSSGAAGTGMMDLYSQDLENSDSIVSVQKVLAAKDELFKKSMRSVKEQFNGTASLSKSGNLMVPTFKSSGGKVKDYRYMMTEETMGKHLGKTYNAEIAMGKMYATLISKPRGESFNKMAIEQAHKDYKKHYKRDPDGFVKISPDSKDKELVEYWNILTDEAKDHIKKVWGSDKMYVHNDMVHLMVGFKKLSVAKSAGDTFNISPSNQKVVQVASNIWKSVVKTAKNNVVLFTPAVVTANVISNTLLLTLKGVNPIDSVRDQKRGVQELTRHIDWVRERDILQREVDSGIAPFSSSSERRERINKLNGLIEKSPIRRLIDDGVFQTIVDDVSVYDSPLTSAVENNLPEVFSKVANTYDNLPSYVRDAIDVSMLSNKTQIGQHIRNATAYSDFSARYALFRKMESDPKYRGNKGRDRMFAEIMETFVSYEEPTSPALTWANDNGLLMYTKFFLRIMKVVVKASMERPDNALALTIGQKLIAEAPTIDDSFSVFGLANRAYSPTTVASQATDIPLLNMLGVD